jgi:hypothetical protein
MAKIQGKLKKVTCILNTNKLFKESISNRKLPLDKLIPALENFCFQTLEYSIEAFSKSITPSERQIFLRDMNV